MKLKIILIIIGSALAALAAFSYAYIFVAGAPQLDRPSIESAQQTGLSFHLETFQSRSMKSARTYGVILPPNYQQTPQKRYPVIFLLHGGHDDARSFYDKYGITEVLHDLYQTGQLPPAIIIMPDGNDNRGSSPLWDPDYFNGPNGNVATLIGSELVQVVESRYRTLPKPKYWAMGGFSSGAWGAVNIGLRHLDNFGTLFSHGGYFTDDSGPHNSPQSFVTNLSPSQRKMLRIYLDAGDNGEDALFRASSAEFHQTLNQLGISNVFHVFPGGHGITGADVGWNYIHKHLYDSLTYVGQPLRH